MTPMYACVVLLTEHILLCQNKLSQASKNNNGLLIRHKVSTRQPYWIRSVQCKLEPTAIIGKAKCSDELHNASIISSG